MLTKSNLETAPLMRAILDTVVYADIFDYPLTAGQIRRYLTGLNAPAENVSAQLEQMCAGAGPLQHAGQYYLLRGRESIIAARARRERVSARLWPAARRYGRLIAGLPFVRMVAVTGSLAMNNVEEDGDIDYLIISANGRLWLCRLLVLVLVRLAAWQKINLCPNYLLTERALEIPNQGLYAAHEFTQMVPLTGLDVYERMRKLNPWVTNYLPNADGLPPAADGLLRSAPKPVLLRALLEKMLMTPLGAWLEGWEMKRKIRKLSLENMGNPEAFFSSDSCKGHSNRHGQRTEINLHERLSHLALEFEK